jgi:hypothetical protein
MSGQIFISYRREESRWSAGRLFDRLTARFDRRQIFMDIDGIGLGEDFVETIEKKVGACDVLIAVIGAHWLNSSDQQGGRRLDNPEDFVRMEIGTALRRNIRVIPVLVDGALMPKATDLPDDLKRLARRNALLIGDTHFDDDCRRLVAAIEEVVEKAEAERKQREDAERLDESQASGSELRQRSMHVRKKNWNLNHGCNLRRSHRRQLLIGLKRTSLPTRCRTFIHWHQRLLSQRRHPLQTESHERESVEAVDRFLGDRDVHSGLWGTGLPRYHSAPFTFPSIRADHSGKSKSNSNCQSDR